MIFETDNQTLVDLNLLGKYKPNSIYSLFCNTVTSGGELLMEQMFRSPLVESDEINRRVSEFQWFKSHNIPFSVNSDQCEEAEQYLLSKEYNFGSKLMRVLKLKMLEVVGKDIRLELWRKNIEAAAYFLIKIKEYVEQFDATIYSTPLGKEVEAIRNALSGKAFEPICKHDWNSRLSVSEVFRFDKIMLWELKGEIGNILTTIYRMDVDTVVGEVARERDFCFATIASDSNVTMEIEGLYHPCLKGAKANDLGMSKDRNLVFLTGANMAGKSTLMKSFGIAVYMAHMGFPIAASSMAFSLQQGLYSSINVSDNLNMGYSHFYAEVLRVKNVAIEVSRNKRLVVIFDELFKGTNVKDAYDATLAVTAALADRNNCALMISTHIIEVATELAQMCQNVNFEYLPTVMNGSVPTYTYKLKQGITGDKHGMIIIENEGVIDIILGKNRIK